MPLYWLFFASLALAQVTDITIYTPANYYTFLPPAAGSSYSDPVFGSTIKRLSNATATPDDANGSGFLRFISNEYSSMTPFNQDNSRILLQHFSYFGLYDGTGQFLKNLPFVVCAGCEPRWSRSKPGELYFINDNQLKRLDVTRNSISVVHTFSEYKKISGAGESDICFDGNHFVFAGDNRYVFVYEISTNTKGKVFDTAGRGFDSLYITPNDNVLIGWYEVGTGRFNGVEMFDRNMTFVRHVANTLAHMDVTRDVNGDEVLLWVNAADRMATCPNAVVKIRLADASQTCLISFDWSLASHVSATDNSGWAFVETYAPGDPRPASAGWARYTNEILQIKLDGSQVRRLAHHRSRPFDKYHYTPRVSASRDGSRVIFTSNYGLQSIVASVLASASSSTSKSTFSSILGSLGSTPQAIRRYTGNEYNDAYLMQASPGTAGSAIPGSATAARSAKRPN